MAETPSPQTAEPAKYVAFLRDNVEIASPLGHVRTRLCGDGRWLLPLADRATDDGETLNMRLSPSSARLRLGVPAKVRLDRCSEHGGTIMIPIRWEATTLSGLFPVLDGNLELRGTDDNACRLSISASYRPPLDAVGGWLDRMAFHRVAESTVRSFLGLMASSLGETSSGGEDAAGASAMPRAPRAEIG